MRNRKHDKSRDPEQQVDLEAGGGLNQAAVEATGPASQPTDDLGSGLGETRGDARQNPRGQISGIGGTRGSGAGTGHLAEAPD